MDKKEHFLYWIDGKKRITDFRGEKVRLGDLLSSTMHQGWSSTFSTGENLFLLKDYKDWFKFNHNGVFEVKCNIYFSPKEKVKKYLKLLEKQDVQFYQDLSKGLEICYRECLIK